jgi:hypothetical protein
LSLAFLAAFGAVNSAEAQGFGQGEMARFAKLALDCVGKEYPNKIAHSLNSAEDVQPPSKLTPAFYGCFDWHSSVHGHWLLARAARLNPDAPFAPDARRALARSLTPAHIAGEVKYLVAEGRTSFERPYGLAWLLQLAAELKEWKDPEAAEWERTLRPLENAVTAKIAAWLPKLEHPIRVGEHANTAFAMGLMLDYARVSGSAAFGKLVESRARDYYAKDHRCPVDYEPSGEDFLSPCLAEADLMRRVLSEAEFGPWFETFLPEIPFEPTRVADFNDGKLYHLAGLNLSRAWMLEGILTKLSKSSPRRGKLSDLAATLRQVGLASITGEHYEGGHWLGSFAAYLVTGRGLR